MAKLTRRFGRFRATPALKMLIVGAAMIAGVAAIGTTVANYAGQFAMNRAWVSEVEVTKNSQSAQDLLESARDAGIVRFDTQARQLAVLPCEAMHDPSVASASGQRLSDGALVILTKLCTSGTGGDILAEIERWNSSFKLLAIRDNRSLQPVCDDGRQITTNVLPTGCKLPGWSANRIAGQTAAGERLLAPLPPLEDALPPQRDYAAVAKRRTPWSSDWLMIAPFESGTPGQSDSAAMVLSTDLIKARGPFVVDLIGEPRAIRINGQERTVRPNANRQSVIAGGVRVSIELLCNQRDFEDFPPGRRCQRAREISTAHAYRMVVRPPRGRTFKMEIETGFSRNVPQDLNDVLDPQKKTGKTSINLRRTAHLQVGCDKSGLSPACNLSWKVSTAVERFGRKSHRIVLRDGNTDLVDASGRLVPKALELGLAPLVGYGTSDLGSLTAGLATRRQSGNLKVRLSVDGKMQDSVRRAIEAAVKENANSVRRGGRKIPLQFVRGGLVLIDAEDDEGAGAIRAIAAWPSFEGGMHEWDLGALATGRENENPLSGHTWRATDVHTTPGSTFKLASALASINEVAKTGDKTLQDIVLGAAPLREVQNALADGRPAVVLPINRNRSMTVKGGFAKSHLPVSRTSCPPGRPGVGVQIGVCEAIIKSSNAYFAGVALYLDAKKVGRTARPSQEFSLASTIGRIFPVKGIGFDGKPPSVSPTLDLARGIAPGAVKLTTDPISIPASDPPTKSRPRGGSRLDVGLNGFGQGVSATPVAIASIYASIATGKVTMPRVIEEALVIKTIKDEVQETPTPLKKYRDEGDPLFEGAKDEAFIKAAMASVHAGLKGVVVPQAGGTATRAFPKLRDRVFGKTGTADTNNPTALSFGRPNTVWFAGWIEPDEKTGIKRRLAFACWITHSSSFGGSICAPTINRVMEELNGPIEKAGAGKKRKAKKQ